MDDDTILTKTPGTRISQGEDKENTRRRQGESRENSISH
jgi:hypothetical protein